MLRRRPFSGTVPKILSEPAPRKRHYRLQLTTEDHKLEVGKLTQFLEKCGEI